MEVSFTERVRSRTEVIPFVSDKSFISTSQTDPVVTPPEPECSGSFNGYWNIDHGTPPKQGAITENIVDNVLSAEYRQYCWDNGLEFAKRNFKEVTHNKDSSRYITDIEQSRMAQWCVSTYQGWPYYTTTSRKYYQSINSNWISTNYVHDEIGDPMYEPAAFMVDKYAHLGIVHEVTYADLAATYQKLKPTFERKLGSVSIPNFLVELRDIRSLSKLFSTKYSGIAEAAGDKFLGVNFGVLPLVGDIQKILYLRKGIEKYIRLWNELADNNVIASFHETMFNFSTSEKASVPIVSDEGNGTIAISSDLKSKAYMHMYVRPKRIDLDLTDEIFDFLSGLNAGSIAEVVWEAIPFSFVIDWFTNIGDLFESNENESFLKFEVVEAGYSYKYEHVATSSPAMDCYPQRGFKSMPYQAASWQQRKLRYLRRRIPVEELPRLELKGDGFILESEFASPHQVALGGSLIAVLSRSR